MIEIDGSSGSGGGQVLRSATSLSAVTQKPCHLFNIRKGRPKPGLAPQHLVGVRALSQLCNGGLKGDEPRSEEIYFYPGEIEAKDLQIKIKTAGSITLVLQSLLLPSLFAKQPLKITFDGGGTDTFFSPTIDYFQHVFLKILKKIGGDIEINILKRGYYPKGGAKVQIIVKPTQLKSLNLIKKGKLQKILALSGTSNLLKNKKVAERQLAGVREIIGKTGLPTEERANYYPTSCPGSQVCLIAQFENTSIGSDNLGKLGKRAEKVGQEAAVQLLEEERTGAALDRYMGDQILPFIALSPKKSSISVTKITEHCKTNMKIIEKFVKGKFKIKENLVTWTSDN